MEVKPFLYYFLPSLISHSEISLFRGWSLQCTASFFCLPFLFILGDLSGKHLPSSQLVSHGFFYSLCLSYVPRGNSRLYFCFGLEAVRAGRGSPRMPSSPPRSFLLGAREGRRGDRLLTIQYSNVPLLLLFLKRLP